MNVYDTWSPSFVAILSRELGLHPIPFTQCLIPVVDRNKSGSDSYLYRGGD
jgi:hypothetical protein